MSEAGKAKIIARAKANAGKPEEIRFQIVTMSIAQARSFGHEIEREIFEAAGYGSANDYWRVAMSEPMAAPKFVNLLARHQIDPRKNKNNYWLRQRLAEALKIAAEARKPWLTFNGDIAWVKAEEEGTGWQVPEGLVLRDPKKAAKWMLGLPKRQPLIPPGLRDFIEGTGNDPEPIYRSGAPGRPTSMHLIEAEMRKRADRGELQKSMLAEFESLSKWLGEKHPRAHPTKSKTISNNLRPLYNKLKSPE